MRPQLVIAETAGAAGRIPRISAEELGRLTFGLAGLAFLAVAAPVVWRGAPLGDDFTNCLLPQELGLHGFLSASWDRLGVVRLARFLEILVTTVVCRTLPFGIAILVPLALTLAVALQVRSLLRDLEAPAPWPEVSAALWLLQPLGTEAALWPAALHVPLGLWLALLALRFHRRGRSVLAAACAIGAALSAEQTILALPLAGWLVTPPERRSRALMVSGLVVLAVVAAFSTWPGADPRLQAGIGDQLAALVRNPLFYVAFPAVGLGVHSIPLAVLWALPWSVLVLAAGAAAGAIAARQIAVGSGVTPQEATRYAGCLIALLALANAPVLTNVLRQGSPRLFAPTWLILAAVLPLIATRVRWRRPWLLGATAGGFAAGAVLSLALSTSVRLATADFNERAAHLIAERIPDRSDVAVCGVRRTVTEPAPRGAFAVHELLYDWSARYSVLYYTGRRARFHIAGELWPDRACPDVTQVQAVIAFDRLLEGARR